MNKTFMNIRPELLRLVLQALEQSAPTGEHVSSKNAFLHAEAIETVRTVLGKPTVRKECREIVSKAINAPPALCELAKEIAEQVVFQINQRAPKTRIKHQYKSQWTLEMLIELLQKKV